MILKVNIGISETSDARWPLHHYANSVNKNEKFIKIYRTTLDLGTFSYI